MPALFEIARQINIEPLPSKVKGCFRLGVDMGLGDVPAPRWCVVDLGAADREPRLARYQATNLRSRSAYCGLLLASTRPLLDAGGSTILASGLSVGHFDDTGR